MFNKKQFARNAVANWASFLISTIITLAMSPYILGKIGDMQFGFWSLVVSVTGYYGFIDMGIRSAVGQYVTRYITRKEFQSLSDTVNTSITVMAGIGLIVAIIASLAAWLLPNIINIDPRNANEIRLPMLIVGLGIAIKFPFTVFQATISGNQRYDIMNAATVSLRIVNALFIYLALELGLKLLGLALVTLVSQILESAAMYFIAARLNPELKLVPLGFTSKAFQEVRNYGIFSFLINVSDQIIFYTSSLVIAMRIGPVAVTYFAIGANLMPYFIKLVRSVSTPLIHTATAYDARNEAGSLCTLFLTGGRYVFAFACLIASNIFVVGEAFLGRWMGEKFLLDEPYGSSGRVMIILAVAHTFYLSQAVSRQIIFGSRKNKFLAFANGSEALCNLALSLALAGRFGILGVAVGMLVPMMINNGLVIPIYVSRQVGTGYFDYLRRVILPNLGAMLPTILIGRYLTSDLSGHGWGGIVISAVVVSGIYAVAVWVFVLEGSIRRKLLGRLAGLSPARDKAEAPSLPAASTPSATSARDEE